MTQAAVAWLTFAGTVILALGALVGTWIKSRVDNKAADAAQQDADTNQLQALWKHVNAQDAKIVTLEGKVQVLEDQAVKDKDVRHELKNALIYVVSIANAAIAQIVERFTDEQVDALPEPLRSHVKDKLEGRDPFEDHLELSRPRTA